MDIKALIQTLDGITDTTVETKTTLNENASGGASSAGGFAPIASSVGSVKRRVPKKTKVAEEEINEEDLLVDPHLVKPQAGFTPRSSVRTDHEVSMATNDLLQCGKNAETIYNILRGVSEQQGLPGWVQKLITQANQNLNSVAEYMEGEYRQHIEQNRLQDSKGGYGVVAGGTTMEEDQPIFYGADKPAQPWAAIDKIAGGKTTMEAASRAQQAAIAVNMKKQGKKPKSAKSTKESVESVEEGWKGALAGAALAGLTAMTPAQARVSIGPDGQPTQSYAQQLSQQPGFQASQEKPSNTVLPGANLPRADAVNRQASTVTVDGRDYKMIMLEPDSMRPRGGQRIAIPQAMMGERGIGNYIGILAGETVYVLPRGVNEGTITEKAKSKQQQKFFGMVHAIQKGKKIKGASAELKKAAADMSKGDVTDFAKTKHKGLPTKKKAKSKVDESLQSIEQRLDESWKKWSR